MNFETSIVSAVTPAGKAETKIAERAGLSEGKPSGAEDFATVFERATSSMVSSLRESEAAAIGAMKGEVSAQEVVFKIMTAERQLQHALAVRDKLVSAYQEVSRMQI